MKRLSVLAAIVGLAVTFGLVAHIGVDAVARPLAAIGWSGFAAVCAIHLTLIAVMGIAWGVLLPETPVWVTIWGRLVRDGGSELLPLSQVGGYVLGARAVLLAGVSGTDAAASTIVDVTLELFGQLSYIALALFWLLHLQPEAAALALPVAAGLAVAGFAAAGFVAVQRRGFHLLDRLGRALGRGWADKTAAGAAALHVALSSIYRNRWGVLSSFALHFACWIAATLEAWLALRFAGAPLGFAAVLVIESLLYAARSVAFVVPSAVGLQEGAYILLGGYFGLGVETALALSLLKRARDVAIGLPPLVAWQLLESGRLWHRIAVPRRGQSFQSETPVTRTGAAVPSARLR